MNHKLVVDRIEEDQVVCQFENGREVIIPLQVIPDNVGEGDALYMKITTQNNKEDEGKKTATAQELLNELLT